MYYNVNNNMIYVVLGENKQYIHTQAVETFDIEIMIFMSGLNYEMGKWNITWQCI